MKRLFSFKENTKIALLLPVMVVLIITLIVASKSEISQVDKSVHSIYHDRLVAGRAITLIMDLHYQNHFLVSKYMETNTLSVQPLLENQVNHNYHQMDSIMGEFSKTLLVSEEKQALKAYELQNKAHRAFQQQLFGLQTKEDMTSTLSLYSQQEESSFQSVLAILRQLSMVQTQVGKTLLQDSEKSIRLIQELSFLEIAFVIILFAAIEMVVFLMMVKMGQKLHPTNQKYWLN